MELNITLETGRRLRLAHSRYLGDGVYTGIDTDSGMMVLCTYNGIQASNLIWLEAEVQYALLCYLKSLEERGAP